MMKRKPMFEQLETRRLLAAAPLTIGPNQVYFNAVTSSNTDTQAINNDSSSGGPHTSDYELRFQNTGTKRISVTSIKVRGTNQDAFQLTDFPSAGQSFGLGKQINYNIRFTAGATVGLETAFLVISTSNANYTNIRVPLRALVTKGEGTTFEPSLQDVFNLYGFPINAGEQANTANPYFVPASKTDEVNVSTLVKADDSKDVVVRPLAEFTNHATPAVRMGFYTPGEASSEQYLWYSPKESSQSVTPLVYGQTSFDPGSGAFGLVTQYPFFTNPDGTTTNVYSENVLNKRMYTSNTAKTTTLVHMKFYPYKDQNGNTVANAYIVAEEEFGQDNVSDSQDLVFVVTNVKPAPDKATVSVQNLIGFPSDDIASFNVIKNHDTNYDNVVRDTNTFRVTNSGTQTLVATFGLTGANAGDYTITSGGGSNVGIAPGGYRDVTVKFQATSGTSVHKATLTISSNDTATPTESVSLLGNWQEYSEQQGPSTPSLEPSAPKLVNQLLGYQTTLLNAGQTFQQIGSLKVYPGDAIDASYFQTADTNAPVNVTQLATFHNQTYLDTNGNPQPTTSFLGWYPQGSPLAVSNLGTDKPGQGQMILGPQSNGTVYHGKFKVSGTNKFGIVVEHSTSTPSTKPGEYSDPDLNIEAAGQQPAEQAKFGGVFLRFYQAVDEHGVPIPNTFLMLHDYNKDSTNYDFQDNIYLISNIMVAGAMKTPRTVYAQKTSAGNLINFTSPDDGPNVKGFNVYRSTTPANPSSWTLLNTGGTLPRKASGSYTDTSAGSTKYYYAVTTVGAGGVESQKYVVAP